MNSQDLFQQLDAYNWDNDQEFQLGLKGILESSQPQTDEQKQDVNLKARCFYFARKFGKNVDFNAYKEFKSDGPTLSYAELVDLIQSGKEGEIPGIKQIPDTVLTGQGTESTASKRRKPWEKDDASKEDPASINI